MDMFVVNGGTSLTGTVRISGAKNAALPMMSAALLADGKTIINDVPDLVDVRTLSSLLAELGATVEFDKGQIKIDVVDESNITADYDLVRKMRASICVLGPLLAKRGRACVSLPGGCNIGHRPIDLHLKGLRALGAEIEVRNGYVSASAKQLRGARIYLGGSFGSTVTGTCNVMSAATLAEGETIIDAAACEPEVVALGEMLNNMGAHISGLGTSKLTIEGVTELKPVEVTNISDRIEAATLMIAAMVTRGTITLDNVQIEHLTAVLETLHLMGAKTVVQGDALTITSPKEVKSANLTALPYPGIPTDIQAQLMVLLSLARGGGVIRDEVFPDRFMHVSELVRMGASIQHRAGCAFVSGVDALSGTNVMACDLRASAALILAGLAAKGESVIRRIYHLDRGYEQLEKKLSLLGAAVKRVVDDGQFRIEPPKTSPQRKSA